MSRQIVDRARNRFSNPPEAAFSETLTVTHRRPTTFIIYVWREEMGGGQSQVVLNQ